MGPATQVLRASPADLLHDRHQGPAPWVVAADGDCKSLQVARAKLPSRLRASVPRSRDAEGWREGVLGDMVPSCLSSWDALLPRGTRFPVFPPE